jgi:DNA-directed RNA polymerase subunit N (RpoN/RPB10)
VSTRAGIARWTDKTKKEWAGRYHHWDGYPSGLGATLYQLVRSKTLGDLSTTLRVLIDDHPAGWSTINGADWGKRPGYEDSAKARCTSCGRKAWEHYAQYYKTTQQRKRLEAILAGFAPERVARIRRKEEFVLWHAFEHDVTTTRRATCYCHGARREEPWEVTHSKAAGSGVEWAYIFDVPRRAMTVLEAVVGGRHSMGMFGAGDPAASWCERALVVFDNPEPDWMALQS